MTHLSGYSKNFRFAEFKKKIMCVHGTRAPHQAAENELSSPSTGMATTNFAHGIRSICLLFQYHIHQRLKGSTESGPPRRP